MAVLRTILRFIDRLSDASGSVGKWFALVLVGVGTYETISRHVFGAPTIWSYDVLTMAGGAMYLLGASYDYKRNAHTRVDLIYSRLPLRVRALIDVIASLVLFFPLVTVLLWYSASWMLKAFRTNEIITNSFWYPPAWPYRTLFTVALLLLTLQGLAQFARDVYVVFKGEAIDQPQS